MNYLIKKAVKQNGRDLVVDQLDMDYACRVITLSGEIDMDAALRLNAALRALARESDEDITLYIFSPGGSVNAGYSILDTIRSLPCDVVTVASGLAASMAAFLVAVGGAKGKRYAQPNSEIMIHQPLGGASGQATDVRIMAEHLLRVRTKLNHDLAEATGQPLQVIEQDTERDFYMDAEAAKAYGLVDHVGDPASMKEE